METNIITVFCIIDDLLKSINFEDNEQAVIKTSEVMTVQITSCMYFAGNIEKTRIFLKEHGYVPKMVSKYRLNRRLHKINTSIWEMLSWSLSRVFINRNESKEYSVDSFPVKVCHNIRIKRSKIYKGEEFRGFSASKKEYFYGIKVHAIVSKTKEPIEFIFAPGASHDGPISKQFDFDLPEGSIINGDSAYTDYEFEEELKDDIQINFRVSRKSNSTRPYIPALEYLISNGRKIVETSFSGITGLFGKKIHAVTARGFELKVYAFVLAYSFLQL